MRPCQPLSMWAMPTLAAELLGIAQESFDSTLQYLKERKQFGVLIGSFQALQHRAAHWWSEVELCKSVVLKALQAYDQLMPKSVTGQYCQSQTL